MFNVSIVETRSIIRAIYDRYGFDISGYAMSSLRFRIGRILIDHKLLYADALISRILEDTDFLDIFIHEISVGSPDLLRDPDFWIELRDQVIPELLSKNTGFEILVPSSVTGDELYSLAILMNESGWTGRIQMVATCLNKKIIDNIQEGLISQVRYKTSCDNYRIFNPKGQLDSYIYYNNGKILRSSQLLKQVRFLVKKPTALPISNRTMVILFRNRLLYVNQALKRKILTDIAGKMNVGTYLILGIRESLKGTGLENDLHSVSTELNIYRKGIDK